MQLRDRYPFFADEPAKSSSDMFRVLQSNSIFSGVKLGILFPRSQSLIAWSLLPRMAPSCLWVNPARSRINRINSPDLRSTTPPDYTSNGCNKRHPLVIWRNGLSDRSIRSLKARPHPLISRLRWGRAFPIPDYKQLTDIPNYDSIAPTLDKGRNRHARSSSDHRAPPRGRTLDSCHGPPSNFGPSAARRTATAA